VEPATIKSRRVSISGLLQRQRRYTRTAEKKNPSAFGEGVQSQVTLVLGVVYPRSGAAAGGGGGGGGGGGAGQVAPTAITVPSGHDCVAGGSGGSGAGGGGGGAGAIVIATPKGTAFDAKGTLSPTPAAAEMKE
jgi:hypothetical protein